MATFELTARMAVHGYHVYKGISLAMNSPVARVYLCAYIIITLKNDGRIRTDPNERSCGSQETTKTT